MFLRLNLINNLQKIFENFIFYDILKTVNVPM